MKTINAMALRRRLGAVLDGVARGRPIAVARGERPLVVLVPFESYREEENRAVRLRRLSSAFERLDEWRRGPGRKLRGFRPAAAVRAVREGR